MRYQPIASKMWRSKRFRALSKDAKILWLYLNSCDHSNCIGIYKLPLGYIETDTGYRKKRIEKILGELANPAQNDGKEFIKYDQDTEIMFILRWLKYKPLENSNQVKGAITVLNNLPDCEFLKEFRDMVDIREQIHTASKGWPLYKPLIHELNARIKKMEV